jgi:Lrp/AsnC family transcriptional regulator of ectoine degradation
MKLDRFDVCILDALQSDGRMPATRLADRIGLSVSPTWERVRKLEKNGIVRGYHADVAIESITGLSHVIVTVALEKHRAESFRRLEEAVAATPEITACWAVGGTIDYVLHFVVPDIGDYQAVIDRTFREDLGIRQYWSYVVTKTVKSPTKLPLALLLSVESP